MRFSPTDLAGAFLLDVEPLEDNRGFFARSFCHDEFRAHGLNPEFVQCNISFNYRRGTLRGMHFQVSPHAEAKVVRCTQGAIWDVIIDLRTDSPTRYRWFGVELSARTRRALYVPEGFAHGFQTLVDESEVLYLMSEFYHPECARGVRWDDPRFGIPWPLPDPVVSVRDNTFPLT